MCTVYSKRHQWIRGLEPRGRDEERGEMQIGILSKLCLLLCPFGVKKSFDRRIFEKGKRGERGQIKGFPRSDPKSPHQKLFSFRKEGGSGKLCPRARRRRRKIPPLKESLGHIVDVGLIAFFSFFVCVCVIHTIYTASNKDVFSHMSAK